MDSEEEMLKSSEEALENHILSVKKDIVDQELMELLELKINLLKEYDRNTVKMTSNLLEASSTGHEFEILQNTIQQRVVTHKEQYESVHKVLEILTITILNEGADLEKSEDAHDKPKDEGNNA